MPFALNVIYSRLAGDPLAAAVVPMASSRQVSRGWARKVPGQGPVAHRRPALPLVSRGERGRGLAVAAAGARDGPPAAQLGGRDLDHDHDTGLAVARRTYPDLVTFYAPLDFSWSTRRAIAQIRPTVLALVELELWPNLIRCREARGAKVAIINARLSSAQLPWIPQLAKRHCNARWAGSTWWRPRMANMRGDSSNWEFRAIESASPVRSSTTGWKATGTMARRESCGSCWAWRQRPGLRGGQHDGRGGGRGAGGVSGALGGSIRACG